MTKILGTLTQLSKLEHQSAIQSRLNTVRVPASQWVTVLNPDGIRSQNHTFRFHSHGIIEFGGGLTVLDQDEHQVLVRYEAPAPAAGTAVPSGTMFLLPLEEFDQMNAAYYRIKADIAIEQALVANLLTAKERGSIRIQPGSQRVDTCNLCTIRSKYSSYEYGASAVIHAGDLLQEIGRHEGRVLVECTTTTEPTGTSAPNGTLFFMEESVFDTLELHTEN